MKKNFWKFLLGVIVAIFVLMFFWKILFTIVILGVIGYGIFKIFGNKIKNIFKR